MSIIVKLQCAVRSGGVQGIESREQFIGIPFAPQRFRVALSQKFEEKGGVVTPSVRHGASQVGAKQ